MRNALAFANKTQRRMVSAAIGTVFVQETPEAARTAVAHAWPSLMTHKGYTAVGLAEVVTAAGVPKGSFYYYFKSKEDFGHAMLEEYFAEYLTKVDTVMTRTSSGAEKLLAYYDYWSETQGTDQPEGKCLVVKLGPELATCPKTCARYSIKAPKTS